MLAISVKNLTKKFKSFTAVNGLSFDIAKNHVVGFLGPNGSGKTTTLRMLVGLSKITDGLITISDVPVTFGSIKSNLKVGYLPELPSFYNWMSGREYLEFIADIFKISTKKRNAKIKNLLEVVDLVESQNNKISTYSGGMKQRLGIAQALINDPEVIILDEPVSALDPIGRKEVLRVIEKLKENRTILFSTHILSDVDRICDDVVIINHGKLVVSKPLAELKAEYATPILEIEFVSDAVEVARSVKNEKWVKKLEQNGRSIKIWLNDNKVVKDNIPFEYFAKKGLGILQYGLRLPETEDLFVELLGEENE
jgi:ABC-2 type transport system ATP-binding protein